MKTYHLSSGDILITTAEDFPIIQHAAVVIIESGELFVWHTSAGTGIVKDRLSNFLRLRTLIDVRKTKQNAFNVNRRIRELNNKPYSLLNFNCFHFVQAVTS